MLFDRVRSPSRRTGFTLVEIMIVVAVLGILMTVALPLYMNFQKKAKQAEARSNLGGIRSAMIAHYAESNTYAVGAIGSLVYNGGDNTGTPYGSSLLAAGKNKLRWNGNTVFSVVGYAPEGMVYFNYSLVTSASPSGFTAMASADLDENTWVCHYYLNDSSPALNQVGDPY